MGDPDGVLCSCVQPKFRATAAIWRVSFCSLFPIKKSLKTKSLPFLIVSFKILFNRIWIYYHYTIIPNLSSEIIPTIRWSLYNPLNIVSYFHLCTFLFLFILLHVVWHAFFLFKCSFSAPSTLKHFLRIYTPEGTKWISSNCFSPHRSLVNTLCSTIKHWLKMNWNSNIVAAS